jgi:allantoinase
MYADLIITGNVATHYGVFEGISIAILDGKIVGMGRKDALPAAAQELDYSDFLILPGVVDPHVHSLGDKYEGFYNATYAAAAGGTTTINDHPLDIGGAPTSKADILRKVEKASPEVVVDFSLFASAVPEKLEDIADVADSGITGFKTLMHATSGASTYGLRAVNDAELYQIFEEIAKVDQRVMVHAENDWIQQFLEARLIQQDKVYLSAHNESRPEMIELVAAFTAIELARLLGTRLHIVHTTLPQIFEMVVKARSEGVKVTAETCPHYLVYNEDKWRDIGAQFKINPPLRPDATRLALWETLKQGKIDLVSTDHAPHPENHLPNVFENFSGSPGVETNLQVMYSEGVARGRIDITDLARLLSYNPARLLGIYPQKGVIMVGSDADLVIFDPNKAWTITADKLHMQAGWTMYEGLEARGKVFATYVRGKKVYEDGEVIGEKGYGQWVKKVRNYDF